MNPSAYPAFYLTLPIWLDDGTAMTVPIRQYLQSGQGKQSARALAAKARLVPAIAKELKRPGNLPVLFEIAGYPIARLSIDRVFMGKGAPDEIQDVIWLASRYGIVTAGNVQTYCDTNLGVDCGGFVACLWGIGKPQAGQAVEGSTGFKPRSFWNFDRSKRRAAIGDVAIGDAIIFFKHMKGDDTDLASTDPALGGEAFHIGAVSGIRIGAGQIDLGIMESSGAATNFGGNGVNIRVAAALTVKTAKGLVYCEGKTNDHGQATRLYFVGKSGNFGSYLPYGLSDDVLAA